VALIANCGALGLVTVTGTEFEVTPPEGKMLTTTTLSVPGVAVIAAGIVASTSVLVTLVTGTG